MPDLPDISQNFDDPLPQVDPNSELVPYRMSRTDPGGQPVVTTGYGQRARPPIQPPGGGGPQFPDLDRIANAAFSNLPVDEAIKATEAATRFIGLRGYQKELESGQNAAQAFAKWGPMLFRQATGIPEAIDRSVPTPITPQQLIQNRLRQQQIDNEQKAAQARIDAAKVMTPYQSAQVDLRRQEMATKAKELAPEKKAELTDAYKELDEARKDMAKLSDKPVDDPAVIDANVRMSGAQNRINKIRGPVAPVAPVAPAAPAPIKALPFPKSKTDAVKGEVYQTKNGPLRWNGEHFVAP